MEWYEELGYADELDARLANRTPCEPDPDLTNEPAVDDIDI